MNERADQTTRDPSSCVVSGPRVSLFYHYGRVGPYQCMNRFGLSTIDVARVTTTTYGLIAVYKFPGDIKRLLKGWDV
jgi:hypothetical protein